MSRHLLVFIFLVFTYNVSCITIDLESAQAVRNVSSKFVGVTLDAGLIGKRWKTFNFTSQKVLTLAKGMSPSYLRIGGTAGDRMIFNMTHDQRNSPNHRHYAMKVADWDNLNHLVMNAGLDLIFNFNVLLRKNGHWDPTNAKELLEYTVKQGYKPAGYELGNEPNYFRGAVSEKQLAKDFAALKNIVSSSGVPPFLTIGPDVGGMLPGSKAPTFLKNFLEAGGGDVVDVVTVHQYYSTGRNVTLKDFTDRKVLDTFIPEVDLFVKTCNEKAPNKQCWLGETSSFSHGGAPHISDRYVAGFLWLDKLGLSALRGLQGVLRQQFYGGNYALLDTNLNPNPDYWLTLIYKRLVGSPVFDVTQTKDPNVRVYAHCTNVSSSIGYKPGSITVYFYKPGSVMVYYILL
ncbi:heparanase-like [Patella vulgata]|uniref:heparanase-like n=1 Tax=Patella vulgata TaxID=6465 RepID=UPI0024A87355|nr:heparanase-like [Patella vulgata]